MFKTFKKELFDDIANIEKNVFWINHKKLGEKY